MPPLHGNPPRSRSPSPPPLRKSKRTSLGPPAKARRLESEDTFSLEDGSDPHPATVTRKSNTAPGAAPSKRTVPTKATVTGKVSLAAKTSVARKVNIAPKPTITRKAVPNRGRSTVQPEEEEEDDPPSRQPRPLPLSLASTQPGDACKEFICFLSIKSSF